MRKLLFLCLTLLSLNLAFGQKEPLNYALSFARFKQFYNTGLGDSIYNMFGVTVKAALSREKTQDLVNSLQQQYGMLEASKVFSSSAQGLIYESVFSKGEILNITYALNDKNEITGLFFGPGAKKNQNPALDNFIVLGSLGNDIKGTLSVPIQKGPCALVIIVAGSGPTDRDGNSPLGVSANTYKMMADCLQQAGVASLRYDKCGIGSSADPKVSENQVRFETMVDDLVAFIKKAKSDGRFNKVILAGHSEGSLVSMLAARKEAVDGLISISGPSKPADEMLKEQLGASMPDKIQEVEATLEAIRNGKAAKPEDRSLQQIFQPSVQGYLRSWMQYDPRKEIANLTIPILIIQGTTDLQVQTAEAEALKKAQPNAQLLIIPQMAHTLKTAPADRTENLKTYEDPELPLSEGLCSSLISFCTQKK